VGRCGNCTGHEVFRVKRARKGTSTVPFSEGSALALILRSIRNTPSGDHTPVRLAILNWAIEASSVYVSRRRFDNEYENKDLSSNSAVGCLSSAGLPGKSINKHRGNKVRKREQRIPYLIVLLPVSSWY